MNETLDQLKKENKVKGVDYEIQSKLHFDYQWTSSNQFKISSGKKTCVILFIKMIQTRDAQDGLHPCGHLLAILKRN